MDLALYHFKADPYVGQKGRHFMFKDVEVYDISRVHDVSES